MDWKLPDFLQQTLGKNPLQESSSSSPVEEEHDDLAATTVQHKGTVPYRRVESAVHTFVHVAVPADLDRLYRHQSNIKKWKKKNEFEKLRAEYINSARTVKQLTLNLKEMETLRAKVLKEDLKKFDNELKSAKESALSAVFEFFKIHGDGLNSASDGSSIVKSTDQPNNTHSNLTTDIKDTQQVHNIKADNETAVGTATSSGDSNYSRVCGDLEKNENSDSSNSRGALREEESAPMVQMRGNQLVIAPSSTQDVTNFDHPLSDLGADGRDEPDKEDQAMQNQVEKSKPEQESEEVWEKLRKDLLDLHGMISDFSTIVHAQGEVVDDIESNIEQAEENIQEGNKLLKKATVLKAALFPVMGAVVGGVIGGPIGLVAGLKLGSVTSGLAAASVTGTLIGYQGGKILKKQHNPENMEMQERKEENEREEEDKK